MGSAPRALAPTLSHIGTALPASGVAQEGHTCSGASPPLPAGRSRPRAPPRRPANGILA